MDKSFRPLWSVMLLGMTDDRLAELLDVYADHPLDDGDAVLVLDDAVCLELGGLAAHWDPMVRASTASIVRSTATRAIVLIARPDARLQDSDYQLWRELHADLRDSAVQLLPVRALPAAA